MIYSIIYTLGRERSIHGKVVGEVLESSVVASEDQVQNIVPRGIVARSDL